MYQSSITQEGYILIGKEETKTNEQIMSESLTKYDLTHTMAPFLDTHLFFDIFSHFENNNTNCYLKEDLLNAKLELVKQTNMVDMEMELFQQLNGNAAVPTEMQGKKEAVDKRCKDLQTAAGSNSIQDWGHTQCGVHADLAGQMWWTLHASWRQI